MALHDYSVMDESRIQYLSDYAYVVEWERIEYETGEIITEYTTITSNDELTMTEISEEFYDWFDDDNFDGDRYDSSAIVGTPAVCQCFKR